VSQWERDNVVLDETVRISPWKRKRESATRSLIDWGPFVPLSFCFLSGGTLALHPISGVVRGCAGMRRDVAEGVGSPQGNAVKTTESETFVEARLVHTWHYFAVLRRPSAAGSVIRWIYVLSWIAPRRNGG